VFDVELPLRTLLDAPKLVELADAIDEGRAASTGERGRLLPVVVSSPEERDKPFPLTDLQQAYWVGQSDLFELGQIVAHTYWELELTGLDLDRAERVARQLIERHEMLRAIVLADGTQRILPEVPPFELERIDLRERDPEFVETSLTAVRRRMSDQGPATGRWPLYELRAHLLDGDRVRLHVSKSLLVTDGWGTELLIQEAIRLYRDLDAPLPPLELSYRDYVLALANAPDSELHRAARAYWAGRMESLPASPELPLVPFKETAGHPGFVRRVGELDAESWTRLKDRARAAGLTPTALVCAAYTQVVAAWSKTEHFTITVLFANRLPLHPRVNDVVGNFSTTTLLEVDARGPEAFGVRARRLEEQLWRDLEHSTVSGIELVRDLASAQGWSGRVMMPVVFTSELNLSARRQDLFDWREFEVFSSLQTPQVFLDHRVAEEGGTLVLNWDTVDGAFAPGVPEAMFAAYRRLLERLVDENVPWETSPVAVVERPLAAPESALVPQKLLNELVREAAVGRADQPAVIAPDRTLTYSELLRAATRLGRHVRHLGARPNRLVAVVMDKGWEQVVAALGVLEAGAAYLPVDPTAPRERIAHVLQHGEVELVLTQPWLESKIEWPQGVRLIAIDDGLLAGWDEEPLPAAQTPEDLAYVIFTSGSTGLPKGVMVDHRGAANTVLDVNRRFGIGAGDSVLALSALHFDLSVYDIFGLLGAGGTIVLPEPAGTRDPTHWARLLREHRVTVWNSVPALMEMLVDSIAGRPERTPGHLRVVMLSGDWIPLTLPRRIAQLTDGAHVISLGGATEASIWSIFFPIEEVDPAWTSIPYGRPLSSQTVDVLDSRLDMRPDWVAGELYIGGAGVARGYWHDDVRTTAQFFTDPRTGQQLYKTGDLGRYLPDGNIEFLGRDDFQVKVRGHRIELGEIEAALLNHPAVETAVVTAPESARGAKRLIAYVVGAEPTERALRVFLEERLPEYMIPAGFVFLDGLPLTGNGKVDRTALPNPEEVVAAAQAPTTAAPATSTEKALARLWEEVLGISELGLDDSFFESGGDSLAAAKLAARLHAEFGVDVSLRAFFERPTIAGLGALLEVGR
jgi:amino acid adenylation domain-containing protein